VVHSGEQVRVGDFLDAEVIQGLQVKLRLALLELWNGYLSMVDGQEIHHLFEILNLLIFDFEGGLKGQNGALLG